MQSKINELQNEAIAAATDHIREQRKKNANIRLIAYCVTIVACVAIVCATILGVYTIREQQYALNMQYASLIDYVSGAEITTTTSEADSGDGGLAVAESGNTVVGGDMNGDS